MTSLLSACSPQANNSSVITTNADGIIGGTEVQATDKIQNSIVAVYDAFEGEICTGSLLPNNIVLTAAHCIGYFTEDMYVFFGTEITALSERRQVDKVEVSPYWENRQGEDFDTGDIAMIHFTGTVPAGYKPVTFLPNKRSLKTGMEITVAGYGISDGVTGDGVGRLRSTKVTISNLNYSTSEFLIDQTKGTGACHGDSGGPAYVEIKGELYLMGVTSRGVKDDNNDCSQFSAFTSTLYYKTWINRMATKLSKSLVNPDQALQK
ncbi:trypsin-like serine protease [Bdellovibrio bacteriovorus]|uniref:S1 family peptidase n=1 Tax=Bdellovibrio bacteriovorus TaxID=959 RepID=UPI0021D2AE48|nr:trypsin-like serine protease [Bdellovibrio bacteriovorus]UXR64197.1 trypsin-like serine protease [Bdellovibrio bacteriovorus]